MKTSGMIRLCTAILSAIAYTVPVSAQSYYSSQTSFSVASSDKEFIAYRNIMDEAKPATRENPRSGFSTIISENAANDKGFYFKTMSNNDSLSTEINKTNNEDKINFRSTSFVYPTNSKADVGIAEYPSELLMIYAKALKEYAKKNGFDTSYAFLSNMGLLCNKKRFFCCQPGNHENRTVRFGVSWSRARTNDLR